MLNSYLFPLREAARVVVASTVFLLPCAQAAVFELTAESSSLEVFVPKAGLFSFAGHEHTIRARQLAGQLEWDGNATAAPRLAVSVPVAGLSVDDEGLSEKDQQKVTANMVSDQVLDAETQPVIRFTSTAVEIRSEKEWKVTGNLSVAGRTAEISFQAQVEVGDGQLRAIGTVPLKLKWFGIEPVKALAGTIKTGDTVDVRFDVLAASPSR